MEERRRQLKDKVEEIEGDMDESKKLEKWHILV